MRRHFWRYSRPVGCFFCVLFLLFLAWFLRLINGIPPLDAEAGLRRIERKHLRPPGELVEMFTGGQRDVIAVTQRNGEIYTYFLVPKDSVQTGEPRYSDGGPWRDTETDFSWGCCTNAFYEFDVNNGSAVLKQWIYVLVKNADPAITSGSLRVVTRQGNNSRTWTAQAERMNPYYLAFRLELWGGSETAKQQFYTIYNGYSPSPDVEAAASVVFFNVDGNEVSRQQFDMVKASWDQERSTDNGT